MHPCREEAERLQDPPVESFWGDELHAAGQAAGEFRRTPRNFENQRFLQK